MSVDYNEEFDKIEKTLIEWESNFQEFMVKLKLFLDWQKAATNIGCNSSEANIFWDQARYKFGETPLEAVKHHKLIKPFSIEDLYRLKAHDDTRYSLFIIRMENCLSSYSKISAYQMTIDLP